MPPRLAAACKHLNHDHVAATARTSAGQHTWRVRCHIRLLLRVGGRRSDVEECAGCRDVSTCITGEGSPKSLKAAFGMGRDATISSLEQADCGKAAGATTLSRPPARVVVAIRRRIVAECEPKNNGLSSRLDNEATSKTNKQPVSRFPFTSIEPDQNVLKTSSNIDIIER
jgi:hypothetical protein